MTGAVSFRERPKTEYEAYIYKLTGHSVGLYISTTLECTVGIMCASLPALRPLFTRSTTRADGDVESHSHQRRRSEARKRRRTMAEKKPSNVEFVTMAMLEGNAYQDQTSDLAPTDTAARSLPNEGGSSDRRKDTSGRASVNWI